MKDYITFRDLDNENQLQYYVLQRDFPHYIAQISTYPKENLIPSIQITGYYLWIVFCGTLKGNLITGYKNTLEDIKFVMNDMAIWYYANRIVVNDKKYKKFKYDTSTIQ